MTGSKRKGSSCKGVKGMKRDREGSNRAIDAGVGRKVRYRKRRGIRRVTVGRRELYNRKNVMIRGQED